MGSGNMSCTKAPLSILVRTSCRMSSSLLSRRSVPHVTKRDATRIFASCISYRNDLLSSSYNYIHLSNADISGKSKKASRTRSERNTKFIPPKAALAVTEEARTLFKGLLRNAPNRDTVGIVLKYEQSKNGDPRMVFTLGFASKLDFSEQDEGVSLELCDDGSPKSPSESFDDGLPKLYVHRSAFVKVLGGTLDVDKKEKMFTPVIFDRHGNVIDNNA